MSDAEVRQLAREILAREEFARWHEEPGVISHWLLWASDLLRSAWSWLREHTPSWLDDLLSGPSGPLALDSLDRLVSIAGTISFVLVALLGATLVRAWLAQSTAPVAATPAAGEAQREDLRVRADALAAEGRFLEAAHAVQLAALQQLLEGRWLELDRFEANRTLRARLAASRLPEEERSRFATLLGRLEVHWFGDREDDRSLFEAWSALHARLGELGDAP